MQKSITLEVIGGHQMSCDGCQQRIQNAVKTLEGVAKVRANARNQRIDVLFDTAKLDATAITERISNVGYQTKVVS
jgi:copper chaperone